MEITYSYARMKTRNAIEHHLEKHSTVERYMFVIWKLLLTSNVRPIERLLGMFTFTAGLWMGWPLNNQHRTGSPLYASLVEHFPPLVWTMFFVCVAIPAIVGCQRERPIWSNVCVPYRVRVWASALSLWIWSFIAIVFFSDGHTALSAVWAPVIAAHELWILLWLWTNKEADNLVK